MLYQLSYSRECGDCSPAIMAAEDQRAKEIRHGRARAARDRARARRRGEGDPRRRRERAARSRSASTRSASSRPRRTGAPTATSSSRRRAPRTSSAASSSTTRRSARARPTGRRSRSCSPRRGSSPASRSTPARSRSPLAEGETVTEGLDGLRERLEEYRALGARFAKWRATYSISDALPSEYCIWTNAHALARYAALCQEAGIVPIVEPEVLHGRRRTRSSAAATSRRACSHAVYTELFDQRVDLAGTLLKPNMVLSGYEAPTAPASTRSPRRRSTCFSKHVPAAVPGIVFLSGGQSDEDATAHLNAMNARGPAPVAAVLLVRARAAGAGAQGVGRQAGERRGRRSARTTTARR